MFVKCSVVIIFFMFIIRITLEMKRLVLKKEKSPIIFLLLIRDDFIEGINQKFIHR